MIMKIPVTSPTIRRREMDAVLSCMVSEKIGPGELNAKLLQQVKESFGIDGSVALRSPSLALAYVLKALEISCGSTVLISALAPSWQYKWLLDAGFVPYVLDVNEETALINAASLQKGIDAGGKALLLHETLASVPSFTSIDEEIDGVQNATAQIDVNGSAQTDDDVQNNLQGETQQGKVVSCVALAKQKGIPIIEDISQSAGSTLQDGTKLGTLGTYAILGLEESDILTAGGGAVVMAPKRKDWIALKNATANAIETDLLPDINAALAFVQLKEQKRNQDIRQEMHELYARSLMQSRHKTFTNEDTNVVSAVYSFAVVLSSGLKDVKQYCSRKDIDIMPAFEKTVIAVFEDEIQNCPVAKSLLLRCVLFPLYPRLGMNHASKIAKVLATLP